MNTGSNPCILSRLDEFSEIRPKIEQPKGRHHE
jgi:hypothetical protein